MQFFCTKHVMKSADKNCITNRTCECKNLFALIISFSTSVPIAYVDNGGDRGENPMSTRVMRIKRC